MELLVVIALGSLLAGAITNVILSVNRTQSFTHELRTVMDDGRISLDRIRKDLRQAKRVLDDGSTESSVRFWIDTNMDGQMSSDELVCYAVREISGEDGYEIVRWTGATADCATPGANATVAARTLVTPDNVFSFDPEPSSDPLAPRTRLVTVRLVLDVATSRGPDAIPVETTIRLRNVS